MYIIMGHYKMLDRMPSAMITSNQNELKIYQGNVVYLNNGDNFELRFFNPLKEKIGVEIIFNGIRKGDGYLILNPGQDITLDRFLDEQRKMLFETYTVDGNNKAAMEAIEDNGFITVNFHKELYSRTEPNLDVKYDFPPKRQKQVKGTRGKHGTWGQTHYNCTSGTGGTGGWYGTNTANMGTNTANMGTIDYSEYIAENTTNTMNYSANFLTSNLIETGRVEMGDVSNQNLKTVNLQFKPESFHSVSLKIMPASTINKTVSEIRQYCECGYRIRKQSWKFCPKCGRRL